MLDILSILYEGSTECGPQMIAPRALKVDELSKDQSEDDTSTKDEEDKLCLMANSTTQGLESKQQEDIDVDKIGSLKQAYHELLSKSSILLKDYKSLRRNFKKLYKDHT